WVAHEYSYAADQPHAVSSVVRNSGETSEYTDTFTYDANGNMTCRVENGTTWRQSYNAENRLFKIEEITTGDCATGTAGDTWTFYYDGDGNRIKEVFAAATTGDYTKLFLGGGTYNVEDPSGTPVITKYYSVADRRVAMRDNAGTLFLITDHLGSIVAVTDNTGSLVDASEERYAAFGSTRQSASSPTDFGYTGQRSLTAVGLMDYNARWYAPSLGRFTQPDTIVPKFDNPQSLNRYSYVYNNPLRYNDPTGNYPYDCFADADCAQFVFGQHPDWATPFISQVASDFGVTLPSDVDWEYLDTSSYENECVGLSCEHLVSSGFNVWEDGAQLVFVTNLGEYVTVEGDDTKVYITWHGLELYFYGPGGSYEILGGLLVHEARHVLQESHYEDPNSTIGEALRGESDEAIGAWLEYDAYKAQDQFYQSRGLLRGNHPAEQVVGASKSRTYYWIQYNAITGNETEPPDYIGGRSGSFTRSHSSRGFQSPPRRNPWSSKID
ncbi:MAG: RHS repeat-associated core domain-containing protein, partial [Chloroflexi bacterium]|nr:RHS repeat-associated core domain-containing protein [Chloroflexota bacterium]